MRRILTTTITLYWTAAFAALAAVCTLQFDHGIVEAFRLLGLTHITSTAAEAGGIWLTGMFGVAFGLIAMVFLWALVANLLDDGLLGDGEEVLRLAFASGGFALAVLLVSAALLSVSGVFSTMAMQFGALLISYVAAHIERHPAPVRRGDTASVARAMASNAARNYGMTRSGQGQEMSRGGR